MVIADIRHLLAQLPITTTAMPSSERLHYMDNLRALAMLAGVGFHAALAYSTLAHAYVPTADLEHSLLVDLGIWFLHLFRMPLFFVIAGFFAAAMVAKQGLAGMLADRFRRIAIPLVIFLPLAHAALAYSTLHAAATVDHPSPILVLIQDFSKMASPPQQPPGTGHLWFLYYLLYFYLLVWSVRSFGLDRLAAALRNIKLGWQLGVLPWLLVPALASVSAPHPAPESLFPQFWAFGYYGPCFVAGYLLYGHDTSLERLRPLVPWLLIGSLLCYGGFWYLLDRQIAGTASAYAPVWIAALEAYISVWMTCVSLALGRCLLNRSHTSMRYLSQSAYWVYLVHLPILFAIQYQLMDAQWPWQMKFLIATTATFGACLLSYQLLRRTKVLRWVLGAH